ncbi:hypothetical protein KQI18_01355 [Clostridioides mangenotii]|uniref:hypothetical protein n=1 Tax=Metaclostridioides mangenotii TaxID=1540 RepID=UPI001C10B48E|nr:hypothetical protein [Clostridioides mangenotii]MBU5306421.1 hypothetical protein [Clostridioides mangenotii]
MKKYYLSMLIFIISLIIGIFAVKFGVIIKDDGTVLEPGLKLMPIVIIGFLMSVFLLIKTFIRNK